MGKENLRLPVDEVIDFICDAYRFGGVVYGVVQDGIQPVPDAMALVKEREQISEFIKDWPTFVAQAKDIHDNEPTEIIEGVIECLGVGAGKAREIIKAALIFGAAAYETYQAGVNLAAVVKS